MYLQAIIFDFDGVIADTEALHLRAFQQVLGDRGVELTAADYYARYLGLDDYHVLRAVARDCGLASDDTRLAEILHDKAARYERLIATTAVLYDGVEQRLREWSREVPLAIASGALRSEIERILQRNDLLSCFAAIVTAKDVARGKPAPDPYLTALERLHVAARAEALPSRAMKTDVAQGFKGTRRPANDARHRTRDAGHRPAHITPGGCVVIEDSLPGIEAARAADMRTVAVTTNYSAERLANADLVVPSVFALDLQTLDALVRNHSEQ
jgi:beta-phosphoglucomutase-like phosphatase (HAD superfamily)